MSATKNKIIAQSLIAVVSALLLIFIIAKADWSYFNKVNIAFQPIVVLLTTISVVALFLFRTTTIFLFLPKSTAIPFHRLLFPSSKYQFLSLIAPMHAADLLLPFILKNTTSTGVSHHFMMVYILRLTDLLVLFTIFVITFNLVAKLSGFEYEFILYTALVVTVLIYLYPFFFIEKILLLVDKLCAYFNCQAAIFDRIRTQISGFRRNFSLIDMISIISSVALTWLFFALMFYYIFQIYEFRISFIEALFCAAMVNIAALIPMQTFGGIGLRESTLLLGLVMLGYSVELSAAYAVTIRLTALFFQLIVFFIIFLVLTLADRCNKKLI